MKPHTAARMVKVRPTENGVPWQGSYRVCRPCGLMLRLPAGDQRDFICCGTAWSPQIQQ